MMELRNTKWSLEELFDTRKEVLSQWPTGGAVDLDEGIEYSKNLSGKKSWVKWLQKAVKEGRMLLDVLIGHATLKQTLKHMQYLEDRFEFDCHVVNPDTYTRKSRFGLAQRGMEESEKRGESTLNGYPIVNYGVEKTRILQDSTKYFVRHTACTDNDARLQAEIALASGSNAIASHSIHETLQHSKDDPLDKRIRNSQYISRLASYYAERGVPVLLYELMILNGWDPPAVKMALGVLQSLMDAEQGVKYVSGMFGQSVCLVQDVATGRAYRALVKEYLHRFGYHDVETWFAHLCFMGAWPADLFQAAATVAYATTAAVLAGADELVLKSTEEGSFIATEKGNANALKVAKQIISMLRGQRLVSKEVDEEAEMLKLEARAIIDKVIEVGGGDIAVGQVKAVEMGILDTAFTPYIHAKGRVLPVRDKNGALRFLDYGNLPLPKEAIEYERAKIEERAKADSIKADLDMVTKDIVCLTLPFEKIIA